MMSQNTALARFAADQIRRIVMVGNRRKYMKNLDRVIEDIFDYPKLATKVANARNQYELMFVMEGFGFDAIRIFRDSQLYAALEDLVLMDFDLRRLKNQMENEKRKRGKISKGDVKLYDRIAKLYRRTVKAICSALNIKNRRSAQFMSSYQGARKFVRVHEDRDFFNGFGVWDDDGTFYPEEDGSWFGGESTDYFEQYMRNSRTPFQPGRYGTRPRYDMNEMFSELDEEDDDAWPNAPRDRVRDFDPSAEARYAVWQQGGRDLDDRIRRDIRPPSAAQVEGVANYVNGQRRYNTSLLNLIGSPGGATPNGRAREYASQAQQASAPAMQETNRLLQTLVKKLDTSTDLLVMLAQRSAEPEAPPDTYAHHWPDEPKTFTTGAGHVFRHVDVLPDAPPEVDSDEAEERELDGAFDAQNAERADNPGDSAEASPNELDKASLIGLVNGERAGGSVVQSSEEVSETPEDDQIEDGPPPKTGDNR